MLPIVNGAACLAETAGSLFFTGAAVEWFDRGGSASLIAAEAGEQEPRLNG